MKGCAGMVLSVLATLACVALAAVWIWDSDSTHVGERYLSQFVAFGNGRTVLEARLAGDGISLAVCRYQKPLNHYDPRARFVRTRGHGWSVAEVRTRGYALAGFAATEQCLEGDLHAAFLTRWELTTPIGFLIIIIALVPISSTVRRRKGRRQSRIDAGLCEHCGYDLRASTNCCPECGTPIPARRAASVNVSAASSE